MRPPIRYPGAGIIVITPAPERTRCLFDDPWYVAELILIAALCFGVARWGWA